MTALPAPEHNQVSWTPLWYSFLAGAATGFGGFFVILVERLPKAKAFASGLAAVVMLSVSLWDIFLPLCQEVGFLTPTIIFFSGFILLRLLLRLVPEPDYGFLLPVSSSKHRAGKEYTRRRRLALILIISLTIHHFLEGLIVSVSGIKSEALGSLVAIAMAMHNIPEGLCIAVPVHSATGNLSLAVAVALFSGMTEPLGALAGLVFLQPIFEGRTWLVSYVLCGIAGMMSAVSVLELIPETIRHWKER